MSTYDKSKLANTLMHQTNSLLACLVPGFYQNLENYTKLKADLARTNLLQARELEEDIEGDDGFLGAFRAEYGVPGLTLDEMFQILRSAKDPASRELLLSPVLRRMLPGVLRRRYPAYWAELTAGNMTGEQLLHKVSGRPGEALSLKEVLAFALRFGFKPVVLNKNGDFISNAIYADPHLAARYQALPAQAPVIKIVEVVKNAFMVEMATPADAHAHNVSYVPFAANQVNAEAAVNDFRKKLAEAADGEKAKVDFSAIVANTRPALSGAGFLHAMGQKISSFFGGMFGSSPLGGFFGGLLGWIMQGFAMVLEAINVGSKAMNPGQDLNADDVRLSSNPAEALLFKNTAAKIEEGDRQGVNALWHKAAKNKESTKEAWDALGEQLDNAGLYKDWDAMLRHQEKELLAGGFIGLERDPAADRAEPQWDAIRHGGRTGPVNPIDIYKGVLHRLQDQIYFSTSKPELQAAVCRVRQDLLNKTKKSQRELESCLNRLSTLREQRDAIINEYHTSAAYLDDVNNGRRPVDPNAHLRFVQAEALLRAEVEIRPGVDGPLVQEILNQEARMAQISLGLAQELSGQMGQLEDPEDSVGRLLVEARGSYALEQRMARIRAETEERAAMHARDRADRDDAPPEGGDVRRDGRGIDPRHMLDGLGDAGRMPRARHR